MATQGLLSEFPPISTETWEQAIRADLKGADYSRKLIRQAEEGLAIKPYYRSEDIAELGFVHATPGDFPYARGTRSAAEWRIRETVEGADPEKANREGHLAIAAGAEEIAFCSLQVAHASDLRLLLAGFEGIPLHLEDADESVLGILIERLNKKAHSAVISAGFDPLSNPDFAANVITSAPQSLVPFTIHGDQFEKWGATAIQEAGLTLAAGIDFLAAMQPHAVSVDRVADSVAFSFVIGSGFFIEIAKLRAFRMLWARALESFGADRDRASARIHARTSRWNETIYDPHVNILRSTTEVISAALGGADSITVAAFDGCFKAPDEAARRLARNTQLILKHEAHLSRVADPGGGSYFLEFLTDSIAREAWQLMQKIEADGGYRKARANGLVAQMLEKSRAAAERSVETRRRALIGTNRYADPKERMLSRKDPSLAGQARRVAQAYEQLRLRTEHFLAKGDKAPRILLAEIGDAKMRAARSHFAADFFACAGLESRTQRFGNTDEIANSEADVIVLCSSDPEYLAIASDLLPQLGGHEREIPVVIAGNPDTAEQLKAIGVADFVHVRTNPIEFLDRWQRHLGIEA
jgi:methylmalonyl-CoA mutase